jgi:hypothetical protein
MADPTPNPPDQPAPSNRLTLPLSSLYLDPNNYRFIDHADYRPVGPEQLTDEEVQRRTQRLILGGPRPENVTDLIASFTQNGWLDVEPIHVRSLGNGRYAVVEGNRRVATLKYLEQRSKLDAVDIGRLDPAIFKAVPCILHDETDAVRQLIVMGLNHISGKKRWPAINQARLIKSLRDEHGMPADDICRSLGVSKREYNLSIETLALAEAYRDSDYGDQMTSEQFNLFREVLKAPTLRDWLSWSRKEETALNQSNLERLFSWLSREPEPDDEEDSDVRTVPSDPVITTGAQIRELAKIIADPNAVQRLDETRSLQAASVSSDLLIKSEIESVSNACARNIEVLLKLAPRMQRADVERIDDLIARLEGVMAMQRRQPSRRSSPREWQTYTEVPQRQFRTIDVREHRGLRAVRLADLGRINIIVGINNAGKTSMLEAVYLLAHQADPRGLLEVVRRRTRTDGSADPTTFVDRLPEQALLDARFDVRDDGDTHVEILCKDDPGTDENVADYLRTLSIQSSYAGRKQSSRTDFFLERPERTTVTGDARWLCPAVFHSPFSLAAPSTLTRCNRASIEAGTKDRVIEFLREHVDPGLRNIELVDEHHRFVVTHDDFGAPLDLSSFGEGMQRIFQIGLLFAGSRGGVVLVDEFENALHTTLLVELTRLIQELAVEMDVQLFLTTHSKEAVDAFLLNETHNEDVVAFGLFREGSTTQVRRYDGPVLRRAIEAVDIDIRRQ